MRTRVTKTLSAFTIIILMVLSCVQPASAYSPITAIDGYDAKQLKEVGITVKSWKHEEIGEDPPQRWVEVSYD